MTSSHKKIPIAAGKRIAEEYGYDQVVIIARKVDTEEIKGCEAVTTYGANTEHCEVAKHIGNFLKYKVMGWTAENET